MYHSGSDVLGVLIARASGPTFEEFLRQRRFDPLGMPDTGFIVPASKLDRLAIAYMENRKTGALDVYDEAANSQWARPPVFPSGGAGLVSTIDDYLAFGQMMLKQGKVGSERILSRLSIEAMTTDQLTREQKAVSCFAPGFFDNRGWGFGVSILNRRDGILLTQRMWTSPSPPPIWLDFWTSAYQAIDD